MVISVELAEKLQFCKKYIHQNKSDEQILALLNCVEKHDIEWLSGLRNFEKGRNQRLEIERLTRIEERKNRQAKERQAPQKKVFEYEDELIFS